MGLTVWYWFFGGAVLGQLLLVVPLASWGWAATSGAGIETAVAKAVSETLRICLELETTTTTSTSPFSGWIAGPPFQAWWLWVILAGFGLLLIGGCCVGVPLLWWWYRLRGSDCDPGASRDSSPRSPQLALPDLARNQLAELRVRHHALRSNRAAAV